MKVAFLLGAGASAAVGMPTTNVITNRLLLGCGVYRDTAERYHADTQLNPNAWQHAHYIRAVCKFLRHLKRRIDEFYHCPGRIPADDSFTRHFGKHVTNYEDLYYMVAQLRDSDLHEYENPALESLMNDLENSSEIKSICRIGKGESWGLDELLKETKLYMRFVVPDLLWEKPDDLSALNILGDAAEDAMLKPIDFYTLNHDIVLETYLKHRNIAHSDGFTDVEEYARYWNFNSMSKPSEVPRIIKLHGSVNWQRSIRAEPCASSACVGIPEAEGFWDNCGGRNEIEPPVILMGTFNKILDYNYSIFADLNCIFHQSLAMTDRLVICGYSFGDKVVNARLLDWLGSNSDHRAVVVDPRAKDIPKYARGAVRNCWGSLVEEGRIVLLDRGLGDVSWDEVRVKL